MFANLHWQFQNFLDEIVATNLPIEQKIADLKYHLLSEQANYEKMLLSFFEQETLEPEQYFYITYTYHDEPIDMERQNEIVVSMLYSLERKFYYEISVFNYQNQHQEYTETFNQYTSFLN